MVIFLYSGSIFLSQLESTSQSTSLKHFYMTSMDFNFDITWYSTIQGDYFHNQYVHAHPMIQGWKSLSTPWHKCHMFLHNDNIVNLISLFFSKVCVINIILYFLIEVSVKPLVMLTWWKAYIQSFLEYQLCMIITIHHSIWITVHHFIMIHSPSINGIVIKDCIL